MLKAVHFTLLAAAFASTAAALDFSALVSAGPACNAADAWCPPVPFVGSTWRPFGCVNNARECSLTLALRSTDR